MQRYNFDPREVIKLFEDEDICHLFGHYGTWGYFTAQLAKTLAGECSFCEVDEEENPTLAGSNKYWRVQLSAFPKKHSEEHVLIIPRRHVIHIRELTVREWLSLLRAGWWVLQNFNLVGGAIIWRFGPVKYTAASIPHSHINIIVPNLKGEIREPIAKTLVKVRENNARREFFLSYIYAGTTPEETWEEHVERHRLKFE